MVKKTFLYLASASPRRREILKIMRIPFKKVKSSYREKMIPGISPVKLVLEHAVGKARKAMLPESARWVLGADTIVCGYGKILGKPRSEKEAFKMLSNLCGRTHAVYTGAAVLDRRTGKIAKGHEKTSVLMNRFSAAEIRAYIKKVDSLDKAGGYAIQIKPFIVKKIKGSYSNVVGLPDALVLRLLRSLRFPLKSARRA